MASRSTTAASARRSSSASRSHPAAPGRLVAPLHLDSGRFPSARDSNAHACRHTCGWSCSPPQRVPRPTRGWRSSDPAAPVTSDIFGSPERPGCVLRTGWSTATQRRSSRNRAGTGDSWSGTTGPAASCISLSSCPTSRSRPGSCACDSAARGQALYARGYGLHGSQGLYWANHTWFFWRQHGTQYAASLHYFGPGTTARPFSSPPSLSPSQRSWSRRVTTDTYARCQSRVWQVLAAIPEARRYCSCGRRGRPSSVIFPAAGRERPSTSTT